MEITEAHPHLSVDIVLFSANDIVCSASTRYRSSPFLGGSTTTTSDPTSQERGPQYLIFNNIGSLSDFSHWYELQRKIQRVICVFVCMCMSECKSLRCWTLTIGVSAWCQLMVLSIDIGKQPTVFSKDSFASLLISMHLTDLEKKNN